jgi:shikimate dehydrogenase
MRKYGLIGFPLSHSFSKRFFTEFFGRESIDAAYFNFEISDISMIRDVLQENPDLSGFNVTIPYKQAIIPFLDTCDSKAAAINAVNTVKIDRSNGKIKLLGFNTDLTGFRKSITPLLKAQHTKALVLGTGGASKAINAVLAELAIPVLVVSREERAGNSVSYDQVNRQIMEEHTVIVNTTPLGTYPKTEGCPELPYRFLNKNHLLFDLVYNPPVTSFLQKGIDCGADVKNGQEMLEFQAMAAWEIWNSKLIIHNS